MYKIGNKTYADAGYHLKRGGSIAYFFEDNGQEIQEVKTDIEDMHATDSIILWKKKKKKKKIIKNGDYGDYKKAIVQKKYSNDDQIAIILNKDSGLEEDLFAYQKMQEWREWASTVAKKIVEVFVVTNP